MNPARRKVFEYLCQFPAAHFSEMARDVGFSTPTLRWHLEKLEKRGFLAKKAVGNKLVYFPVGLVSSEDVDVLCLLHKDKARTVLVLVYNRGGLSQKDIQAETRINGQTLTGYLKSLESAKLLSSLEDGRYRRYYPTNVLLGLSEKHRQALRRFRSSIFNVLQADGVAPRIVRSTDRMNAALYSIARSLNIAHCLIIYLHRWSVS